MTRRASLSLQRYNLKKIKKQRMLLSPYKGNGIYTKKTTSSVCSIIGYCRYDISSNFILFFLQ